MIHIHGEHAAILRFLKCNCDWIKTVEKLYKWFDNIYVRTHNILRTLDIIIQKNLKKGKFPNRKLLMVT